MRVGLITRMLAGSSPASTTGVCVRVARYRIVSPDHAGSNPVVHPGTISYGPLAQSGQSRRFLIVGSKVQILRGPRALGRPETIRTPRSEPHAMSCWDVRLVHGGAGGPWVVVHGWSHAATPAYPSSSVWPEQRSPKPCVGGSNPPLGAKPERQCVRA